jgi:hypothetical protein
MSAYPSAVVGSLYTWNHTIGRKGRLGKDTVCRHPAWCNTGHLHTLELLRDVGQDVVWASYERLLLQASKVPPTVVNKSHFDAFGHLATGWLLCYAFLAQLQASKAGRELRALPLPTGATPAPVNAVNTVTAVNGWTRLTTAVLEAAQSFGPLVASGLARRIQGV